MRRRSASGPEREIPYGVVLGVICAVVLAAGIAMVVTGR